MLAPARLQLWHFPPCAESGAGIRTEKSLLEGRALVMRIAFVALLLISAPAMARAQQEDEPQKVSNDRPDRPLIMPAASSETREAFDDFARFARRGAWERATKALYAIPEAQATRFVDGENGFIVSVARKRRTVLAGLTPEGQAAYRLFYDSDAKKLLDGAEGPTEQATLERIFSSYFLTSVGDNAADRLGDLYFEKSEFDRAADCWLAILRERPDSEISPALLTVKACVALARAGRRSEMESLRSELGDRYGDEVVAVAGRKGKVTEQLRRLIPASSIGNGADPSAAEEGPSPQFEGISAAWQVKFASSVTAGMTQQELTQWEASAASGAVPAVAIDGKRLYVNYMGYVFALDTSSGKMLWRSASFHNLDQSMAQGQGRMVDAKKFAILAAPGYVWCVGRDPKDMNYNAATRLVCRRAETGEVVWQSQDLADYSGIELVGQPLMVRGTIYIGGRTSQSGGGYYYGMSDNARHEYAVAIRPHDGKVLWKTEVGTLREAMRYYYYATMNGTPEPRLAYRAGHLYLDTQQGVLARLDAESGALDWGYGYPTEPVQSSMRGMLFVVNGMIMQAGGGGPSVPSTPLLVGDALLVKGAKSDRICAIDPDRMKVLWERPIARSSHLLAADDKTLYLGGSDLEALDLKGRSLLWSIPLPPGSEEGRVIVRPDGIWQFTARGVFELDPKSGRVRKIFRGTDPGAAGGDLLLTDRLLLTISNRTIAAYPRGSSGGVRAARADAGASKTRGSDD